MPHDLMTAALLDEALVTPVAVATPLEDMERALAALAGDVETLEAEIDLQIVQRTVEFARATIADFATAAFACDTHAVAHCRSVVRRAAARFVQA